MQRSQTTVPSSPSRVLVAELDTAERPEEDEEVGAE
jgi:hypothetical protein